MTQVPLPTKGRWWQGSSVIGRRSFSRNNSRKFISKLREGARLVSRCFPVGGQRSGRVDMSQSREETQGWGNSQHGEVEFRRQCQLWDPCWVKMSETEIARAGRENAHQRWIAPGSFCPLLYPAILGLISPKGASWSCLLGLFSQTHIGVERAPIRGKGAE